MTAADEWLTVESLDLEAQGVAHNAEGKVVFSLLPRCHGECGSQKYTGACNATWMRL